VCQAEEAVASQVFVAGATGRLGCRVVLELLRNKKLKVRAGARNPEEARNLVKTATDYGILTGDAARRLTVVPVDLEDEDSIAPAVGNAGRVGPLLRYLLFAPSCLISNRVCTPESVWRRFGFCYYIMVLHHGIVFCCWTILALILKAPHAQKQHAHFPAVLAAFLWCPSYQLLLRFIQIECSAGCCHVMRWPQQVIGKLHSPAAAGRQTLSV